MQAEAATVVFPHAASDKAKKRGFYLLIIGLFLLFYIFNLMAPLMSDDYNYAFSFADSTRITSFQALFPSIVSHYKWVNGRVVNHFFAQLMLWLGKPVFNVVNAGVAVLFLLGLYTLTAKKKHDISLLALWAGAMLIALPTLSQVFFWLTGACNYLWGSAIIIWSLVPFRRAMVDGKLIKLRWKGLLLLPVYLIMGTTSENGVPAAILLMAFCCVYLYHTEKKISLWMLLAMLCSLAGFIFMLLSPASQARNASTLSQTSSFLGSHIAPFNNCVTYFWEYELIPSLIFIFLLSYAYYHKVSQKKLAFSIMLFLCGVASHFAMTATGYYPLRAMTVSLTMIFSASALLVPEVRATSLKPLIATATLAVSLSALLLCLQAAPLTYDRYRSAQSREQQVIAAQTQGETDIVSYNIKSKSKFDVFYDMIDLTNDPDYFANRVFARYYNLDSVVAYERY